MKSYNTLLVLNTLYQWYQGSVPLGDVCSLLGDHRGQLGAMFRDCGLCDANFLVSQDFDYQAVVNTFLLFLAMRPFKPVDK